MISTSEYERSFREVDDLLLRLKGLRAAAHSAPPPEAAGRRRSQRRYRRRKAAAWAMPSSPWRPGQSCEPRG